MTEQAPTYSTEEKKLDLAYDIFLEMAGENLSDQDIELFNQQFPEQGALLLKETRADWDQEIGVLIDPDFYTEIWIGLLNEQEEMYKAFAVCLISDAEEPEFHMVWNPSV